MIDQGTGVARTVFFSEGMFTYVSPAQVASGLPVVTEVTAEEYLEFARLDMKLGTAHGFINALGNAKRSLHLMVDGLLQNYGLLAHNRRASFPEKLQILDDAGLIALKIFTRLNVVRNLAEHEYKSPDPDQVNDFIDVCQLFRLAMERLGQDIPYNVVAGMRATGRHVYIGLEPALGRLEFRYLTNPRLYQQEAFGAEVDFVIPSIAAMGEESMTRMEPEPFDVIELRRNRSKEWAPILRDLIDHSPAGSARISVLHESMVTIWVGKSFFRDQVGTMTLAQLMGSQDP